jgi:hypothetical protein
MNDLITNLHDCKKGLETRLIPIEQVRLRTDQGAFHRNDWGDLKELALQIMSEGQSVAGSVWRVQDKDGSIWWEVVSGERRLKAIQLANDQLDADIEYYLASNAPPNKDGKKMTDIQVIYFNIHQNSGKPFTTLELGYAFKIALKEGDKIAAIAERCGKSQTWVRNCLAEAEAPIGIRQADLQPTVRRKLAKAPKRVQETVLLKKKFDPAKKVSVKDVEAETESNLLEAPGKPLESFDSIIAGFLSNGWKTKEVAVKDNSFNRRIYEFTFKQLQPMRMVVLVK